MVINNNNKSWEKRRKKINLIKKRIVVDNEAQIDIVTAISGSGPAFFYKVINEIARAGENLRLAGSTYRQAGKASVLSSLGRLVDIPSRRQIW